MLTGILLAAGMLTACDDNQSKGEAAVINGDPFPSTYQPVSSNATLIENVTILDGIGGRIEKGALLMQGGKIVSLGQNLIPTGDTISLIAVYPR